MKRNRCGPQRANVLTRVVSPITLPRRGAESYCMQPHTRQPNRCRRAATAAREASGERRGSARQRAPGSGGPRPRTGHLLRGHSAYEPATPQRRTCCGAGSTRSRPHGMRSCMASSSARLGGTPLAPFPSVRAPLLASGTRVLVACCRGQRARGSVWCRQTLASACCWRGTGTARPPPRKRGGMFQSLLYCRSRRAVLYAVGAMLCCMGHDAGRATRRCSCASRRCSRSKRRSNGRRNASRRPFPVRQCRAHASTARAAREKRLAVATMRRAAQVRCRPHV